MVYETQVQNEPGPLMHIQYLSLKHRYAAAPIPFDSRFQKYLKAKLTRYPSIATVAAMLVGGSCNS